MIQMIKNLLYDMITASGILYYFIKLIEPFIIEKNASNFKVTDEGGATLNVIKYNGRILPAFGVEKFAGFKSLRIRKDDILLCGYPKTGTHWTHEILHMLVAGKAEMTKYGKGLGGMMELLPPIILDSIPSPRVLNSHMLYEELPVQVRARKTKIVWTVRSPKDTLVSYYNHTQTLRSFYEYDGSFENYFKLFMSGQIDYGSYFDYVLAWERVMNSQTDNSILVVEYEKLKKSTVETVKDIARFLNIAVTDDFIHKVVEATNFGKMKDKRTGNKLFRKGQVGDWHNWLSEAQSAEIDKVWQERMSKCFYQPEM